MSIRLRLTLWYTGVLALILVVFSLAVYLVLSVRLRAELDHLLDLKAKELRQSVGLGLGEGQDLARALESGAVELPAMEVFTSPGVYLQLLDLEGEVVARSVNLGSADLPGSPERVERVGRGLATFETVDEGGTRLRLLSRPLYSRGQLLGTIQVATSLGATDRALLQVRLLLIMGSAAGLAAAAAGGVFLARRALNPIDRMTRTAQALARSGDLGQRIARVERVDELGRLASTLNGMLERIEDLFQTQARFVANASHELRTPLTVLRGNVDLLQRGAIVDPEIRDKALANIGEEAKRMSRLVSDLLLLARAEAGLEIEKEPVALAPLLTEACAEARLLADGREIELRVDSVSPILGDALRLRQVLLNLLDNAIRATPPDGRVRLGCSANERAVTITVADTGRGIGAEHLAHVFEPFYRVANGDEDYEGSGLGLTICREIAEAHGGRIHLDSTPGRGTTAVLVLPAYDSQPLRRAAG